MTAGGAAALVVAIAGGLYLWKKSVTPTSIAVTPGAPTNADAQRLFALAAYGKCMAEAQAAGEDLTVGGAAETRCAAMLPKV